MFCVPDFMNDPHYVLDGLDQGWTYPLYSCRVTPAGGTALSRTRKQDWGVVIGDAEVAVTSRQWCPRRKDTSDLL